MKVYLDTEKLKGDSRENIILSAINPNEPIEVVGILESLKEDNETNYLALSHKGSTMAHIQWGRYRVKTGNFLWKPMNPEDTLENIDREYPHPVIWVDKCFTRPTENRQLKNVLDRYDN